MQPNPNPNPSPKFHINEHEDILVEILKRLDGKSLGIAGCVCRLWRTIAASDDGVWEHVCFRHVSPPGSRHLVLALGGYKRLYLLLLRRFRRPEFTRRVLTRHGAQLLLSLFCVDYYEKLGGGGGGGGGGGRIGSDAAPSSLMFLCKPVNV